VDQTEKKGGVLCREGQMMQFREVLEECALSNLGYKGSKFTWTNCRHNGSFINERLDRGVANKARCDIHKTVEIRVMVECMSNHKPLLLQVHDRDRPRVFFKK
jgi:hypothetical protein